MQAEAIRRSSIIVELPGDGSNGGCVGVGGAAPPGSGGEYLWGRSVGVPELVGRWRKGCG